MSERTGSLPSEDADEPEGVLDALAGYPNLDNLTGLSYEIPPDLEALFAVCERPHLRYALRMLGDKQAAKNVVRRCFGHLALNWPHVAKEESPEAYAWKLLKQRVETQLRLAGRPVGSPSAQAAALQDTARATLEAVRCKFAAMESPLGLYTAIAGLPERQYDVFVLYYVLGYTSPHIAKVMGIKPDTVRYHRRLAYQRIAIKLGLSITNETE
ncbi:RNA polymerase sigma factor [Streptomyces sp. NPDC058257]|uniref:RNA polymerase sigma factor n=1 Tax=Streptomyces sp. NPDC058257 TaxID=3346409 RepID=UPI0036E90883